MSVQYHPSSASTASAATASTPTSTASQASARHDQATTAGADPRLLRPAVYQPRRRRWPALVAATIVGAVAAGVYVSGQYDERSLGTRIDDTVSAAGGSVDRGVNDLRVAATGAVAGTTVVADRMASAITDTGITAAVKTALAADPALSALKVEVNTSNGVVQLDGPAPDAKARERAGVLAAAPDGVREVNNRLVVPPSR